MPQDAFLQEKKEHSSLLNSAKEPYSLPASAKSRLEELPQNMNWHQYVEDTTRIIIEKVLPGERRKKIKFSSTTGSAREDKL